MKKFNRVFKHSLLTLLLLMGTNLLHAQVTIGSGEFPIEGALLDLKTKKVENPLSVTDDSNISSTKGFVLPRMKLENKTSLKPLVTDEDHATKITHTGLMVYNIYQSPGTETDSKLIFSPGVYTWNGSEWEKFEYMPHTKFFYMPSIPIPLKTTAPINLYEKYKEQFATPQISSYGAPASIPYYFSALDLYYYITAYDTNVFNTLSLSNDGELTYSVKSTVATEYTFINVVFVPKSLVD